MKVLFGSIFFSIIFLYFTSCSSHNPNEQFNNTKGKISLKFSKSNVPENIISVRATLTKPYIEPIIGELNLLDSNSAEIYFEQIPIGEWHLLVEAFDNMNILRYEGETNVIVVANEITTISLTLQPTPSGTGAIQLIVNWGVAETDWEDYMNNPILESQNTIHDPYGLASPFVIKDENNFRMWFISRANNGRTSIFHATSENGLDWEYQMQVPVLTPGIGGNWDDLAVNAPVVIKEDSVYLMYYTGYRDSYGDWSIGLATSIDGLNWERSLHPVLDGSNELVGSKVTACEILKIDNVYYLYFSSRNVLFDRELRLAKSSDGLNWEVFPDPIMTISQPWEGNSLYYCSVVNDNNQLKMVYMTATDSDCDGFGMAYSTNGLDWNKNINNPIFTDQYTVVSYEKICYPNLVKDDDRMLLYYTGFDYSQKSYINVAQLNLN